MPKYSSPFLMMHKKLCSVCTLAVVLVLVGALNWGIIGLGMLINSGSMDWNVVSKLLGAWPTVEAVVYVLVGVAALYKMFLLGKCCGDKGCKCSEASCQHCK